MWLCSRLIWRTCIWRRRISRRNSFGSHARGCWKTQSRQRPCAKIKWKLLAAGADLLFDAVNSELHTEMVTWKMQLYSANRRALFLPALFSCYLSAHYALVHELGSSIRTAVVESYSYREQINSTWPVQKFTTFSITQSPITRSPPTGKHSQLLEILMSSSTAGLEATSHFKTN
jgi:hypothetical protein